MEEGIKLQQLTPHLELWINIAYGFKLNEAKFEALADIPGNCYNTIKLYKCSFHYTLHRDDIEAKIRIFDGLTGMTLETVELKPTESPRLVEMVFCWGGEG